MGAFRLALLAAFGGVLELLSVKEKLLTSREHKLGSAIRARQLFVNEVHELSRQLSRLRRGCAGV